MDQEGLSTFDDETEEGADYRDYDDNGGGEEGGGLPRGAPFSTELR